MTAEVEKIQADLIQIRAAALRAVDPSGAVRQYLRVSADGGVVQVGGTTWHVSPGQVILIAAGKAAAAMADAACQVLGDAVGRGLVVTRRPLLSGPAFLPASVQLLEAGHPVPDEAGVQAARRAADLLTGLRPEDKVLVLLSGGASALLPLPVAGVELSDLQQLTGLLLKSGAAIQEVNAVRKHLEQLKGGQLARLAQPGQVAALILSDVVGDPLDVIASGPTVPDSSTFGGCLDILRKYHLEERLPPGIAAHLHAGARGEMPETPKRGDAFFGAVSNAVVGSNLLAAEAACREAGRLGYQALLLTTFLEGEAREVGRVAAGLARGIAQQATPFAPPACIVCGGETTVTVRGGGQGGRNQELALAAALGIRGMPAVGVMALATDGSDGPTDAAGAVVTGETISAAAASGLDPWAALEKNDSYPFLRAAGALMHTGPTGTNVNDLLVILVGTGDGN